MLFGGAQENRVVGMSLGRMSWRARINDICAYLYMLLQVLRALEGLATEFTFMGLQRNVYSNMGGNMVALDSGSSTLVPATG